MHYALMLCAAPIACFDLLLFIYCMLLCGSLMDDDLNWIVCECLWVAR